MDEIYVGYLPVPAGIRGYLRLVVPICAGVIIAGALLVATTQRSPGACVWDDAAPRTFAGTVVCNPYPTLYAVDRGDGKPGPVLIVEGGKHGSINRMAAFDGKSVNALGTLLRRDGRRMVELADGPAAVVAVPSAPMVEPSAIEPRGRVTLRGEIIDTKCYLGEMKPGEGKTHKECAILCISGGIPPMLVTRDGAGIRAYYLLVDPSGGPLDPAARAFIADQVEITGDLESQGEINRLKLAVKDIRRL